MTTNHIDQLTEWWETAAPITENVDPGTVIIGCMADGSYEIFTESDRNAPGDYVGGHTEYRILARAPKTKPAWHDAVAVVANHRDYADERRTVWVQFGGDEYDRVNIEGDTAAEHHLVNVTPLIEAKVADEMVKRAAQSLEDAGWDTSDGNAALADALTAALGLETE